MKSTNRLEIIVHVLNFIIFLYFSIVLIRTNPLDIISVIISTVGLFASLIVSILAAIENLKE